MLSARRGVNWRFFLGFTVLGFTVGHLGRDGFGGGLLLAGCPVLEPAAELVQGGRRDVEDLDVGGELHLVPLADEQETYSVIGQRLVYAGGDVFVAAAVGFGVPLLKPGRYGWAGQGNHQAALQVEGFQEDFNIVGGFQNRAGLAFAGDEGVAASVAGLQVAPCPPLRWR